MRIADDFGLGRLHDRVILDLLESGQIDGTSVMIDGAIDEADMKRLRALRQRGAQVGLHLNLTHGFTPETVRMPLGKLILAGLSDRIPADVQSQFQRQAEAFRVAFGSLPDYYDGHQHCHCLPGLATLAARLPRAPATWIRVPLPATPAGLWRNLRAGGPKVAFIAAFAFAARRRFRASGWPANTDFSGFLRLDRPEQVRRWLPRLLQSASKDCLVMVHPGSAHDAGQCPAHAPESRAIEASTLGAWQSS
ncbi:ChbG/HpnK family deacetylase [Shinella daejeonensis]|uniref:ChbG/HpnK family deacetylase n=1 Tax=Shinella daejeonensis TaxID=659017 RepID=UPI0020C7F23F|nr:ChbG/HpnK family deacetylase [Shinella daejeonensis]MCP8894153.1 ChbG/HpnK family deacetylase [Shinella daejeonensis]